MRDDGYLVVPVDAHRLLRYLLTRRRKLKLSCVQSKNYFTFISIVAPECPRQIACGVLPLRS